MCVSDTVSVTVSVVSLTPVASKITLLALADVEIEVAGAVFTLHGVQLRADGEHTKVTMPQYRDLGGGMETGAFSSRRTKRSYRGRCNRRGAGSRNS